MRIRSTLVIACGFAASCSTAGSNNGNNDNGGVDASHGSTTEDGSHGSMPTDAPPDSPKLTTGVYAIPLSTPTNGYLYACTNGQVCPTGSNCASDNLCHPVYIAGAGPADQLAAFLGRPV